MTDQAPLIVWFRQDLRLADNPALYHASINEASVIPLFIEDSDPVRDLGGASKWWLHYSLESLTRDLQSIGLDLIIRRGDPLDVLQDIITQSGAQGVMWNRRYTSSGIKQDKAIKATLQETGITCESFKANLLHEPWEIKTGAGEYYKVFTPYWKAVLRQPDIADCLPVPEKLSTYVGTLETFNIDELKLLPAKPDWGSKMTPYWSPGEQGAMDALNDFLDGPVTSYADDRNRPDLKGTSKLSPHLAFGEISPRQIWHITREKTGEGDKFLSEIGWREFSYTLLYFNPDLAKENYKSDFDAFEWVYNNESLKRWQKGLTGYPIVDAGMRELWETGWQHNRVRMVTASFLIKHLLTDWRDGEKWFWDTLVDADPANNAASWQWIAGSGADASPYFRIFNPITQGQKFDPKGEYVRKWVPEIARLPDKFLHEPWEAPKLVLKEAGVKLGETYPQPIVDHKVARERALSRYKATRE